MSHIGLVCPSASGHLNPMTTLGFELRQRGHRVTLFCIEDAKPKADAAKIDFIPLGREQFPSGSMSERLAELGKLTGPAALRYTLDLFTETTVCVLEEAPDIIRAEKVDLLLVDQASFGGPEVARHLSIPFVSVCCALLFNREPDIPPINTHWPYRPNVAGRIRNWFGYKIVEGLTSSLRRIIKEYRSTWGLPDSNDPNAMFSELAQICQQPPEFEFPRKHLPSTFHFTGPYANVACREASEFPFDRLDGRPLIYASLGTLQNRLKGNYQIIAEACQDLDAQLVVALGGGSDPSEMQGLPGDPILVGYAPQLELLERATLTITHAGMNTTLESLKQGVPMVAIPVTNDQPGVASRIAWSGAGDFIPLQRLSVPRLRKTIDRVLGESSYREHARRLKHSIEDCGGTPTAASIVEEVLKKGSAVHNVDVPQTNQSIP